MYENDVYYTDNSNNNADNNTGSSTGTATGGSNTNTTGNFSGAQNVNRDDYYQNYNYSGTQNESYGSNYSGSYSSGNYNSENYNSSGSRKPEKKKSGIGVKALTLALCGVLFGVCAGAGFYGVNMLNRHLNKSQEVTVESSEEIAEIPTVQTPTQVTTTETKVITADVTAVVEEVMPSMVSIVNKSVQQGSFFGQTFTQESQSSGSGIIVAEDETELLIATNHHVIADSTTLEVTFIDGSVAEAKVKGKDASMDLAVIAIPLDNITAETKQAISIAKLGDSDELKLGEPVIAIGNALGYGQSVTGGWVSALNREIEMEDGSTSTYIQTDAAINGGNSGGALLNMNGEVIGINSSKISGYGVEGMGYAIPISAAEPIISELMTKETKEKVQDGNVGYMGVSIQAITSELNSKYNFPLGVFVLSVEEGSAAEQAGILAGDIITKFDGEKIESNEDLQGALQYCAPGTTVDVIVMRQQNGQYQAVELEITLGQRPQQ